MPSSPFPTRRDFLKAALVGAGLIAVPGIALAKPKAPPPVHGRVIRVVRTDLRDAFYKGLPLPPADEWTDSLQWALTMARTDDVIVIHEGTHKGNIHLPAGVDNVVITGLPWHKILVDKAIRVEGQYCRFYKLHIETTPDFTDFAVVDSRLVNNTTRMTSCLVQWAPETL